MAKKILDANFFQDPELDRYLNSNTQNFVVFTDFACMEAYKGNAIVNIKKSIEIVSHYPGQVIVLKSTPDIIKLQHGVENTTNILFEDKGQTKYFKEFCGHVGMAVAGNSMIAAQLLEHGREASQHFDRMQDDMSKMVDGIAGMSASLRSDHLRSLKKREALSPEAAEEMAQIIFRLTSGTMHKNPNVSAWPDNFHQLRGTFIFRYVLASYLLFTRWISNGGIENVKHHKLRNDVVDMTYVAYGTLFDGLMSKDRKAMEIYEETRFLLDEVFTPERSVSEARL
jgi:hypothetical protein